jgi:TRAP-type C4-dicarboxylate transport system substrate-binding protein
MMTIRRTLATVAAGALASSLAFGALAQDITLRFQHFVSPQGAVAKHFIAGWAEKVEAESNGRIEIQVYPSMQLGGSPLAQYDLIRDGVIDGGWAIPGYTAGRFPMVEVLELPFLTSTNSEASSRAAWDYYVNRLQDEFADVKVLAIHVHGPGVIHTRTRAVNTVGDMDGLKLRAPTRLASAFLEAAGAIPVGMPVPQLPEALSKGVVDGGVIPWEIVVPLKVNEFASYHTEMGGSRSPYNTVFLWAMNNDRYNSLPDDLKAIIDANSGLETSAWAGRAMQNGDGPSRATTAAGGNTITTLDDVATQGFIELADPIISQWIADAEARGMPGAALVEEARSLVAKYD